MIPARTYLSDQFFVAFAFAQMIGCFSLLYHWIFWIYIVTWPIFLVLLMSEYRFIRIGRAMSASMQVDSRMELNTESSSLLRLNTGGQQLFHAQVRLPVLNCIRSKNTWEPLQYDRGDYVAEFKFNCIKLGFESIQFVETEIKSPLKFWVAERMVPVKDCHYRVIPTFKKLSEQELSHYIPIDEISLLGNRKRLISRAADQFHAVREYQFPDPMRHVDQKKTAKYNKLMTRVYEEFFDHHLILILDRGRSMQGEVIGSEKFEFYLSAALTLAENAIDAGDRVSFFSFSQKPYHLIRSTRHFEKFFGLYRGDADLRPHDIESNFDILPQVISQITGQRSIVILLTDASKASTQKALEFSMSEIAQKHYCFVAQLKDPALNSSDLVFELQKKDFGSKEYSQMFYSLWLSEQEQRLRQNLRSSGASLVGSNHNHWLGLISKVYEMARLSTKAG